MTYPKFFNKIETIKLKDDLSDFLGAFENGELEFSYIDVVKTAGHSCPTVLGAFLMTRQALKALYVNELPKRGQIEVSFNESQEEGVAGVIANVISNITGACTTNGFKGIKGNFNRNNLLKFEQNLGNISARFTRVDTQESVDVIYNPNLIPANENMPMLMQKCIQGIATADEKELFKSYWQQRVEKISQSNEVIEIRK